MIQPRELTTEAPLLWTTGTGVEVWKMLSAAAAGDLAAVEGLVRQNPSLVRCQYAYRTPLYFAVRENRLAVAEFLFDRGTNPLGLPVHDSLIDVCRDRGYAEMERLVEVKLEQRHNASPRGDPVGAAIRAGDRDRVRTLLDQNPDRLRWGDRTGNQPIHWATMTRQLELIDELLVRGADINARRQDGARPIHLINGDYTYRGWRDVPAGTTTTPAQVLEHLRRRGAEIDINTAAYTGDLEVVAALLAKDPTRANSLAEHGSYYLGGGSPIRNAAANGHLAIVELLLAHGADPNLAEEGIAPRGHALYAAAANGHHEIARLLLARGAEPSAAVESSADALSRALANGDARMVQLLSQYGAARSVEILGYYGDVGTAAAVFKANPSFADDPVALANAATEGHQAFVHLMLRYRPGLATEIGVAAKTVELTEMLFAAGMSPGHRDWLGVTPLHRLAAAGDLANAALFIRHGADLDACDLDLRSTPLGWAAKAGQSAMVDLLLDNGARADVPADPAWATPVAWATRRGHSEIAARLGRRP